MEEAKGSGRGGFDEERDDGRPLDVDEYERSFDIEVEELRSKGVR